MHDSYLEEFSDVPIGSPVLVGHVFYKIQNRNGTLKVVRNWINEKNSSCQHKPISSTDMQRLYNRYTKRYNKSLEINLRKPVSKKIVTTTCSLDTKAASTPSSASTSTISFSAERDLDPLETRNMSELEFFRRKLVAERLKNVKARERMKKLRKRVCTVEEKYMELKKKLNEYKNTKRQ